MNNNKYIATTIPEIDEFEKPIYNKSISVPFYLFPIEIQELQVEIEKRKREVRKLEVEMRNRIQDLLQK